MTDERTCQSIRHLNNLGFDIHFKYKIDNKTKTMPWRLQALKGAMQQHMDGGLVYLPEKTHMIAVLGFGNEGRYGEIHKVCRSRMANIPAIIDFAE
jgi:hypothetical protein